MDKKIPVYIINLIERPKKRELILKEFSNKDEFEVEIISRHKHKIGAVGLWENINNILATKVKATDNIIIICEDDHQFTKEYSKERLLRCISDAEKKCADILIGGVSGFTNSIQVAPDLFWTERFSGTQFIIIFRPFFHKILEADFHSNDNADYKISSLTNNKFFIHPFISIQKDYGYSDVTANNNAKGRVEKLFTESDQKIEILKKIDNYYKSLLSYQCDLSIPNEFTIPTYIINIPGRERYKMHIKEQFQGKPEFVTKLVRVLQNRSGEVDLWLSIQNIVKTAKKEKQDVIVICNEKHVFTKDYNRTTFIRQVLKAHKLGCNILSGGVRNFVHILPITDSLFWIDSLRTTQFIVIFKSIFFQILTQSFSDIANVNQKLSEVTSQKMILYPFISIQKDSHSSSVIRNERYKVSSCVFEETSKRIKNIVHIRSKYLIKANNFDHELYLH